MLHYTSLNINKRLVAVITGHNLAYMCHLHKVLVNKIYVDFSVVERKGYPLLKQNQRKIIKKFEQVRGGSGQDDIIFVQKGGGV